MRPQMPPRLAHASLLHHLAAPRQPLWPLRPLLQARRRGTRADNFAFLFARRFSPNEVGLNWANAAHFALGSSHPKVK